MVWIFITLLFILGLNIGSFLDVIIYRCYLDKGKTLDSDIVHSSSKCPSCKHKLFWNDLIPLLSFLLLKGKCRYCKKKISSRSFCVEFFTGILFGIYGWYLVGQSFIFNGEGLELIFNFVLIFYSLFVISCLVIILVVDLYKYIIPNKIVFSLIGIGFLIEPFFGFLEIKHGNINVNKFGIDIYWTIKLFYQRIFSQDFPVTYFHVTNISSFINPLVAAFLISFLFILIVFFTKGKGMGMGDVKFVFFMGLFLGIDKIFLAVYLAFIMGAVISLMLVINRKKILKQKIPFGPFLVLGFFVSWFFGERLILLISQLVF